MIDVNGGGDRFGGEHLKALCVVFIVLTLVGAGANAAGCMSRPVLRIHDEGPYIVLLQHYLRVLRYMEDSPDGIFGPETRGAVIRYQKCHGLTPDGIVGASTWELLEKSMLTLRTRRYKIGQGENLWDIGREYGVSVAALARVNDLENPHLVRSGRELVVPLTRSEQDQEVGELVHWDDADRLYPNLTVARVTDTNTGLSFRLRRFHGHFHADAEPLTAEDTRILKQVYGGQWSWERRPVIMELGSRRVAASINGFPHGDGIIMDNNFAGHICVHFLGSRAHETGKIDDRHQEMVLRAAGYP